MAQLVKENDLFIFAASDHSVAAALYKKVRILCWVMTSPGNLEKKAIHVYRTWAHRCNELLFVSSKANDTFPAKVISKYTDLY